MLMSLILENKIQLSIYKSISKNKKVKRIRYTTSHPINMSDELINLHSTNDKLMPFLHLPVQSGSSKILHRMNRKYDTDFYLGIISKLKKVNPNIEISSDFIVGYPGETEKDFNETLRLIEEIRFTQSFSFIYSPRPGTKSSLENDDTPMKIKKTRLQTLQEKLKNIQFNFNKTFIGKKLEVLINRAHQTQNISLEELIHAAVYVKSLDLKPGDIINVNIQLTITKLICIGY